MPFFPPRDGTDIYYETGVRSAALSLRSLMATLRVPIIKSIKGFSPLPGAMVASPTSVGAMTNRASLDIVKK